MGTSDHQTQSPCTISYLCFYLGYWLHQITKWSKTLQTLQRWLLYKYQLRSSWYRRICIKIIWRLTVEKIISKMHLAQRCSLMNEMHIHNNSRLMYYPIYPFLIRVFWFKSVYILKSCFPRHFSICMVKCVHTYFTTDCIVI